MVTYVLRRLVQMGFVFMGASLILFVCLFVLPGDPLQTIQGDESRRLDVATRARLAERYRLDQPLPAQYLNYISRLARGDLGESYRLRRPVNEVLGQKVPSSAKLAVAAVGVQILLGLSAGAIAAVFRSSFLDVLVTVSTTVAIGIPVFVVALVLQDVFAVRLRWLPLHGQRDGLRSLILPALTLGSVHSALVARITRGSLLDVLESDYVRSALAKGLSRRAAILDHALPNSLIPVLTYLGVGLGGLLGGAAIVETIFNWDGVGLAMVTAISAGDNPIVIGVVTYSVVVYVVVNLIVDLACAALDPRIRLR